MRNRHANWIMPRRTRAPNSSIAAIRYPNHAAASTPPVSNCTKRLVPGLFESAHLPGYLTTREPSGRFGPASHTHLLLLFNLVQVVVRNVFSVSRLKYTRTLLPACGVLPMSSHL